MRFQQLRHPTMDTELIAMLSLIVSAAAVAISIIAVRYSRRQAIAAENQVELSIRLSIREARPVGGGKTEYHFTDGTLITCQLTGGGPSFVAYAAIVDADHPRFGPHVSMIETLLSEAEHEP